MAEASPVSYQEVAQCEAIAPQGGKCWTIPVLAAGRLYCRNSRGDLFCLDVGK